MHYITVDKLFTLQCLNERIRAFSFGSAESKNRPSKISVNHLTASGDLKQSGLLTVYNTGMSIQLGLIQFCAFVNNELRYTCIFMFTQLRKCGVLDVSCLSLWVTWYHPKTCIGKTT